MKIIKPILLAAFAIASIVACGQKAADEGADEGVVTATKSLDDFELLPRDLFFDNPTRIQGRISPDGSRMSFMAPLDGVQNLWVGPIGEFDQVEAITDDKLRGITTHQWALNGTNVLYLRDQGGDEDFHIYSVDMETGDTVDLTPFDKVRGIFVGGSYRYPDEYLLGINNRDA